MAGQVPSPTDISYANARLGTRNSPVDQVNRRRHATSDGATPHWATHSHRQRPGYDTLDPSFSSLYPGSRRQRVEFMTMADAPRPMERPPIAQRIVIARDPVTIYYIPLFRRCIQGRDVSVWSSGRWLVRERLCDVKGSGKLPPMTPANPPSRHQASRFPVVCFIQIAANFNSLNDRIACSRRGA